MIGALPVSSLVFALGLAAGCAGLGRLFPLVNEAYLIHQKLEHLAAHRAEYDTLFIGSSRVHRHIDPATFDATTAQLGHPTHSFNFGIDGMFAPEDGFVSEQIFRLRLRGLRYVFLEIGSYLPQAVDPNIESARSIAWHDWRRLRFVTLASFPYKDWARARVARKKHKWEGRPDEWAVLSRTWSMLAPHFHCLVENVLNLGHGNVLTRDWLMTDPSAPAVDKGLLGAAGDGFTGLTNRPDPAAIALFEQDVKERSTAPVREQELDPWGEENLEHIVGLIRAAGAEPIFLLAPNATPIKLAPSRPLGIPTMDFCDLRRWPDFYRVENRQDHGHLNKQGAEIYSRVLATEWLKLPQFRH